MIPAKPAGEDVPLRGYTPMLTARTFVRAAGFTNVLIAALVVVEFCALAVVYRDGRTLLMGLTLLVFFTVAIWLTATFLGGVALLPRWLWLTGQRLIQPARSLPRGRSGVWDEWLDRPFRP